MHTIQLNNGIEMPVLGYGLFQVPPQEAERCTSDALEVGYRLIDMRDHAASDRRDHGVITKLIFRRMTSGVANDAPETRNTQH